MYSDAEILTLLETKIAQRGLGTLSYDDRLLYDVLKSSTLTVCPLCGGVLKRSISSVCAGHGDFPRYLNISCTKCTFDHSGCVDYGNTWRDVEREYIKRCNKIVRSVSGEVQQ